MSCVRERHYRQSHIPLLCPVQISSFIATYVVILVQFKISESGARNLVNDTLV